MWEGASKATGTSADRDGQGASPKEQILEACRRDNVELFEEVLDGLKGQRKEEIANFFNQTTDTMGNHLLHVCANYGACKPRRPRTIPRLTICADDVMNELLDIEFLECDPLTRRDKETPIHCAVRYANEREVELGEAMAKMLIEAGADPRVKDRHGRKPSEICTPRTGELRSALIKEEYVLSEGLKNDSGAQEEGEDGSASDSE